MHSALDDINVLRRLLAHAHGVLSKCLSGHPYTLRCDLAQEALQESSLRALQKRDGFQQSSGNVAPWLHGIMNNVLFEKVRVLKALAKQEPESSAAWERLARDLSVAETDRLIDRDAVSHYLGALSEEHRQLLQLRYCDGLSHREIAARLSITEINARVRLSRALNAARILAGVCPGEGQP